jgi:hypothetical protein
VLESNSVTFTDPSKEELAATRKAMFTQLDIVVADAKLSAEVVDLVKQAIGAAG